MPNDMMMAALRRKRAGEYENPGNPGDPEPDDNPEMGPEELVAKVEELEQRLAAVEEKVGADEEADRGEQDQNEQPSGKPGY